ncbi:hypothetical protein D3C86_1712600 [compost metagenome]
MRTQGHQDFFQRVRRVGVIDHHQRLGTPAKPLHATGRAFEFRQHLENFVQGVVQAEQGANGGEHVAQVEAAEQSAAQEVFALRGNQGGTYAFVVELRFTAI